MAITLEPYADYQEYGSRRGAVAAGTTDDQAIAELTALLHEENYPHDVRVVIGHATDGTETGKRTLAVMGTEANRFGFDVDTSLRALGWEVDLAEDTTQPEEESDFIPGHKNHPMVQSTVTWDAGEPAALTSPSWIPNPTEGSDLSFHTDRPVKVILFELYTTGRYIERIKYRTGEGSARPTPDAWAVITDNRLAGITSDPTIVERVREGRVSNLEGLTCPVARHIPMLASIDSAEVAAQLEDQTLDQMGTAGVDSGQMMILDDDLAGEFVNDRPEFDSLIDTLSYSGACSQTTRRGAYGGTLQHEGDAHAGVSSSGYGDGAYRVYVNQATDLLVVSFIDHEIVQIDGDEEAQEIALYEHYERQGIDSSISGDVLMGNAEKLHFIDGGTFTIDGEALVGDPCYTRSSPELMVPVAVVPGEYRLLLGVHNYGEADSWDTDRVSVMIAARIA